MAIGKQPLRPKSPNQKGRRPMLNMYWMYALIIISLIALYNFQDNTIVKEMGEDEFLTQVQEGNVEKVVINRESATITGTLTKQGAKKLKLTPPDGHDVGAEIKTQAASAERFDDKMSKINNTLREEGKPTVPYEFENGSDFMKIFWYFGPILIFVLFMVFMSRRMNGGGSAGRYFQCRQVAGQGL